MAEDQKTAANKKDFADERTYSDYGGQNQSARDILGPNTFRRRDRIGGPLGRDTSEGARASMQLEGGATPSDLVRTVVGSRDRDIELPSEVAKPPTRKPITAPRSLSGGRR
jgi:hypothetical protein